MAIERDHGDRFAAADGRSGEGVQAGATVVLVILAAAYGLAYFDRMLMVVLGETIKIEFGLSDKQLSLLTGAAFAFMYGGLSVGAGWLIDRRHRITVLAIAVSLWSVMTMACGLARNFVTLALARAGVGVGEAVILPAGFSLLSDLYPPSKRSLASSLFFAGGMIGVLGAFLLGSWLSERLGWRAVFLIAGPPGLLLAVAAVTLAREPRRERPAHSAADLDKASAFRLVAINKPLLFVFAAIGVAAFSNVGVMQWLPMFFIRSHNLSHAEVGLFFGPTLAGGILVGVLIGGWLGNRLSGATVGRLLRTCAWPLLTIPPLYWFALTTPSLTLALGATFLATTCAGLYNPMAASAWQTICDPRARGTAAGLSGFVNTLIGGALLPFFVGALSDGLHPAHGADSLRYSLAVSVTVLAGAAGLFLWSSRLVRASAGERA